VADIYVAVSSFSVEFEGHSKMIRRGATIREGHPLLGEYPGLFKLLVPTYEHTPPPEKKPEPEPKTAPEKPKYILPERPKPQAAKAAAAKPASAEVKVDEKGDAS